MGPPLLPRCVHSAQHLSRHSLDIWRANELQVCSAEYVELGKPGQQSGCLRPQKTCGRVRKAAAARGKGLAASGAPRGGRCLRSAPSGGARDYGDTCAAGTPAVPAASRARAGGWARGCARAMPPARAAGRAAAWVTAGLAFITAGSVARVARPALCVPRSSPCVPNGPPTAAQARGRHEKPALRPPAAPAAAAAAAAHTSRRRRRGHHRGKRPGRTCPPGMRALLVPRGRGGGRRSGDRDREVGPREGYPGPGHLPHSPLGAPGKAPWSLGSGRPGHRALPGRSDHSRSPPPSHACLPLCPRVWSFFLVSWKKFPLAVFSSTFPRLFQPLSLKFKCFKMLRGKTSTPRSWET